MEQPNWFAGNPLDRAGDRRRDAAWVEKCLTAPDSRFLPLWRLRALLRPGDPPRIAWARADVRELAGPASEPILLGVGEGVAHFALDVSHLGSPESELGVSGVAEFSEVRAAAERVSGSEAAILAHARSLVDWHARHRFCAGCGGQTEVRGAGSLRVCTPCEREHFPRVDPVVIMLVERGDQCLLGRQPSWPARLYSAVAGFLEPGETVEEAVRREVREETGIEVGAVRYHSSQPWPFPGSLMIGCIAEARTSEIHVDGNELADARWFTRDQLRAALEPSSSGGPLALPRRIAIAHALIRAWVDGSGSAPRG